MMPSKDTLIGIAVLGCILILLAVAATNIRIACKRHYGESAEIYWDGISCILPDGQIRGL